MTGWAELQRPPGAPRTRCHSWVLHISPPNWPPSICRLDGPVIVSWASAVVPSSGTKTMPCQVPGATGSRFWSNSVPTSRRVPPACALASASGEAQTSRPLIPRPQRRVLTATVSLRFIQVPTTGAAAREVGGDSVDDRPPRPRLGLGIEPQRGIPGRAAGFRSPPPVRLVLEQQAGGLAERPGEMGEHRVAGAA